MRRLIQTIGALAAVLAAGAASAALVDRGGGMIYDTTRNLTWLADMDYALTSGHTGTGVDAASGGMTWDAATAWANNLVYGGYSDWRLPTLNPSDTSCSHSFDPGGGFPKQYLYFNCTGGELSGLFVTELGYNHNGSELITSDDTPEQIANAALFSNVQTAIYWSGTEYAPEPNAAWGFDEENGMQQTDRKSGAWYAAAVRPGDVAASVPEPQTAALVLLAFGLAAVVRRKAS